MPTQLGQFIYSFHFQLLCRNLKFVDDFVGAVDVVSGIFVIFSVVLVDVLFIGSGVFAFARVVVVSGVGIFVFRVVFVVLGIVIFFIGVIVVFIGVVVAVVEMVFVALGVFVVVSEVVVMVVVG